MKTEFNTNNELLRLSFHYDDLDFFEQLEIFINTINEIHPFKIFRAKYEASEINKDCIKITYHYKNDIILNRNKINEIIIDDFSYTIITKDNYYFIFWIISESVTIYNNEK
jgi:hypothetical protein